MVQKRDSKTRQIRVRQWRLSIFKSSRRSRQWLVCWQSLSYFIIRVSAVDCHCQIREFFVITMRYLLFILFFLPSQPLFADLRMQFKYPDGSTNWQHVANWSGSLLIILLSIVVVILFITRRKLSISNKELQEIRGELELRVKERTASLDESNRLLKESNKLLENEIAMHVSTANKLRASEAYIKDILKSMPLMLIGVNNDGNITQWNKRAEDITGISADSILNKNLWESYPIITVSPDHVKEYKKRTCCN